VGTAQKAVCVSSTRDGSVHSICRFVDDPNATAGACVVRADGSSRCFSKKPRSISR
jgi:hypothetical protein